MHPVDGLDGRNITLGFWVKYPNTLFFQKRGLACKPHRGVDFAPSKVFNKVTNKLVEDPRPFFIVSPVRGLIVASFPHNQFGRLVAILCEDTNPTTLHLLCHLDKVRYQLKKGVMINKGDVIGTMGCTGTATERHLHYQVEAERDKKFPTEFPTHYWLKDFYGDFIDPMIFCT